MKSRIITEDEVRIFKNEVALWIECFGISEWRHEVHHQQIGDNRLASVHLDFKERTACFELTQCVEGDFGIDVPVKELALHEVLHVLLADFVREIQRTQDDSAETVVAHEHAIIHRLIPALFSENQLHGTH